ncbi:MAG: hypothetical protein WA708_00095 [Acidobacteriaceae bacterium]
MLKLDRICVICGGYAIWECRRSRNLPWEMLCTACAANQGERAMTRRIDRTRPRRIARLLDRDPEYFRNWRANNREKFRGYLRAWHIRNREKHLAQMRAYYRANREKWKAPRKIA